MSLVVDGLLVGVAEKEILTELSFKLELGEVLAMMGPNGSGKSSLASALMGNPGYRVSGGKVTIDGDDLLAMSADERARKGLMLAFQYPAVIPGVTVRELLLAAVRQRGLQISALELKKRIEKEALVLGVGEELLKRGLNEDFSGGEKKRLEMLQVAILKPRYLIVDEIDSGLDIDALKVVAEKVRMMVDKKQMGVLVITHYQRLLKYLKPNKVVVVKDGQIVAQGESELIEKLEVGGYSQF